LIDCKSYAKRVLVIVEASVCLSCPSVTPLNLIKKYKLRL